MWFEKTPERDPETEVARALAGLHRRPAHGPRLWDRVLGVLEVYGRASRWWRGQRWA